MSSDQPDIKFEDADLYEKFMGVWSRMLGSKFIDWMSPDQGISRGVIMFRYLLLRPFTTVKLGNKERFDKEQIDLVGTTST